MHEQPMNRSDKQTDSSRVGIRVNSRVLVEGGQPAIIVPNTDVRPAGKASKPLKGRFAHVPYSSEDLIREKRKEAELEGLSS